MVTLDPGTQFISFSPNYQIKELRSAAINAETEVITIEDIVSASGGAGISANGFTVVGPIMANITLPENSVVKYTGPLSMGAGYVLTIPIGTTLNIL